MVQMLQHSRQGHGESARWDEVWGGLPAGEVQVFTRAAPRTLKQLCQRCYFEDLWELIGRRHRDGKFLEQGAGRGTTSMYLAAQGCDVTMLDLSPQGFEVAAANFAREGFRTPTFLTADARETGLPSDTYDCVYNIGLLEHFEDPKPVLDEAIRLLKPGGWLFMVIVPRMPEHNAWLGKLLFCPWRLTPASFKRFAKRVLGRVDQAAAEPPMTRTELGADDYLECVRRADVAEARCMPYNPYHDLYLPRWQERWLAVPLFRLHHAVKRLVSRAPWMRTSAGLASCLLLTCRKAG